MALHIQMSEEAEAELRKSAMVNQLSSIAASLVFMVLGGLILYFSVILIAGESPVEFLAYSPPVEDAPPTDKPVTPELSQKQQTPSSDVAPSLIVANAPAAVAMAHVEMDTADLEESSDFGIGLDIGGLGDGLGSGGSGLGSGQKGGSALEGTFYDLKQTKSGSPSDHASKQNGGAVLKPVTAKVHETLSHYIKNWNASVLSKFYSPKTKLYASNFMMPSCSAGYAPLAYKCQDRVAPSAWVAVYRGRVRAPKSGTFRFVGTGDDFIGVRFNNKTVLEAGWAIPSAYNKDRPGECGTMGAMTSAAGKKYREAIAAGKDRDHAQYEFMNLPGIDKWNRELGGLTAGTPFKVEEGKDYPIEIVVSEIPGGAFGFCLLIQDVSTPELKAKKQLDLFRTNFSEPNQAEISKMIGSHSMGAIEFPKYNPDSPIWIAVP